MVGHGGGAAAVDDDSHFFRTVGLSYIAFLDFENDFQVFQKEISTSFINIIVSLRRVVSESALVRFPLPSRVVTLNTDMFIIGLETNLDAGK